MGQGTGSYVTSKAHGCLFRRDVKVSLLLFFLGGGGGGVGGWGGRWEGWGPQGTNRL